MNTEKRKLKKKRRREKKLRKQVIEHREYKLYHDKFTIHIMFNRRIYT